MQKLITRLEALPDTLRSARFVFQLPSSTKTLRRMAEAVNHQQVHDLLVEVARKAGDMIASAQPHVNTSGSKINCTPPSPSIVLRPSAVACERWADEDSGRPRHRDG